MPVLQHKQYDPQDGTSITFRRWSQRPRVNCAQLVFVVSTNALTRYVIVFRSGRHLILIAAIALPRVSALS
jgi:hypothetical protein